MTEFPTLKTTFHGVKIEKKDHCLQLKNNWIQNLEENKLYPVSHTVLCHIIGIYNTINQTENVHY